MKRFIVYKITNSINGKVYIGVTTRLLCQRWGDHCCTARKGRVDNKLYRAMRKYGIDSFTPSEIFTAQNEEELNKKEIEYIQEYNSIEKGYNTLPGGRCQQHTDATKQKMRGYKKTDAHRLNMSKSQKGAVLSTAHYENILKANKKRCRPVLQYSTNGELLHRWGSSREIEKANIAFNSNIIEACHRYTVCKGYLWRFETDAIQAMFPYTGRLLFGVNKKSGLISMYKDISSATIAANISKATILRNIHAVEKRSARRNNHHWFYG